MSDQHRERLDGYYMVWPDDEPAREPMSRAELFAMVVMACLMIGFAIFACAYATGLGDLAGQLLSGFLSLLSGW